MRSRDWSSDVCSSDLTRYFRDQSMANIVIFGASGQVGHELSLRSRDTICLDRAMLDVSDRSAVRETLTRLSPRVVINAAAYTAVDRAEHEPAQARRANTEIGRATCRERGCQ